MAHHLVRRELLHPQQQDAAWRSRNMERVNNSPHWLIVGNGNIGRTT